MELPGGGRFEGKGEETGKGETHKILSEENEEEEGKDRNSLVRSGNNGKGSWENFGFGIWKWKITGAGALCSIGVAAATIFIFILSGPQRQRQQQQQSQKIQFQVYPDEKSIKQVVQQATRLNQAISVVRGVPVTRAHISFGGYYDGL
ncbi:unnamed protein product [Spirodela intermedia]|uniref:DUF6821 domain-containing protein n=1 Tax=Spirodela intermedia TaxID=51605 RepID=A0A7I8IMR7_SPIIN|nr:unnamed protein product [Spirodela intermedia]CAA6659089.1 unnamed protein product [Spirodela intermedia]